jgi:hypothetical protein
MKKQSNKMTPGGVRKRRFFPAEISTDNAKKSRINQDKLNAKNWLKITVKIG